MIQGLSILVVLWKTQESKPLITLPYNRTVFTDRMVLSRQRVSRSYICCQSRASAALLAYIYSFIQSPCIIQQIYGCQKQSDQQYYSNNQLLSMLNPFAIEKSLIQKTETLKDILSKLKCAIAISVVSKNTRSLMDSQFVNKCQELKGSFDTQKLYVCRVCGRQFDQGRKLGGHVSRAHKDNSSSNVEYISSDEQSPQIRVLRRGRKMRKIDVVLEEQSHIEYKKEFRNEQPEQMKEDSEQQCKAEQQAIYEPDP